MRSPEKTVRHRIRIAWCCKHCRQPFGSEIISHYGIDPPNMTKPTWFFATMALLDHLRDCQHTDFSDPLRAQYGSDFLNHPRIWEWYNIHATLDRKFLTPAELDDEGHG